MNETKSTNPAVILLQEILTELKSIRTEIEAMNQNLATPAPAAQPATPSNNGDLVTFETSEIVVSMDDEGKPVYRVRGPLYPKFGIRVWPEVLPKLRLNPADLQPGPNPFSATVLAIMGENHPKKVISLADHNELPEGTPIEPEPEYIAEEEVPF